MAWHFETLKPTSSYVGPLTRAHLLIFLEQFFQLEIKYSNKPKKMPMGYYHSSHPIEEQTAKKRPELRGEMMILCRATIIVVKVDGGHCRTEQSVCFFYKGKTETKAIELVRGIQATPREDYCEELQTNTLMGLRFWILKFLRSFLSLFSSPSLSI